MARVSVLNSPFLLGFDAIERAVDRVARTTSDGYPPYNIERIEPLDHKAGKNEASNQIAIAKLRITLAVAGFTKDQLEITVEEGQLVISGRQQDDKEHEFLYRGIAARNFQRVFLLADGMQVAGADMSNGLLLIDLIRPEPMRFVQKIEITAKD
jgi:HSP20 family molecular chaperone IbpA